MINNCTFFLVDGDLTVLGRFTMNGSSLITLDQTILFDNSKATFFAGEFLLEPGFTVIDSSVVITGNTSVVFNGFDLTQPSFALKMEQSSLETTGTSSLTFINNTVGNGSSVFVLLDSSYSMLDKSSLVVTHNSVRSGWAVLAAFQSQWRVENTAIVNITENFATDYGRIVEINSREFKVCGNASASIQGNYVEDGSIVFFIQEVIAIVDRASIKIANNSASKGSSILTIAGEVLAGEVVADYGYASIIVQNNTAEKQSNIIILQFPLQDRLQALFRLHIFYYDYFSENQLQWKKRSIPSDEGSGDYTPPIIQDYILKLLILFLHHHSYLSFSGEILCFREIY